MLNHTIINRTCFTRQSSAFQIIFIALFGISCQHSTQQDNTTSSISDPHSFANFNQVQVEHLSLNLKADFERKILHGYAELSINNTGQARELVLDTRDLQIKQIIRDDGKEVMFRLGDTMPYLGQALYIPIDPSCKKVKIYYSTSPDAAAIQWLSPAQTAGGDFPFLFTQSQAILARSWVPCQDGPGNKFTYDATITCPPELMALMSAENDTLLHKDGVYHFIMQQPIPSYLLALTIGHFKYQSLGTTCGVYTEPSVLEKAVYEFADMQDMIKTASKLYGNYSWGRYDVVVLPPSFPFGGMENPRLTFATPTIIAGDRSLVSLIAHELAHSWSGNLVTNSTWNDFWLNEGFTVYFENRIMEALYGKEYAAMHEVIGYGELQRTLHEMGENSPFTHLKLDMKGMDPDEAVSDIAYEKGRFFLKSIEEAVGRQKWDAFLNKYFSQFAFKSLTTEEFLQYLEKELIKGDVQVKNTIVANTWIYAPGLPQQFKAPHAVAFDQVLSEKERFMKGEKACSLQTKAWSTFHWMHFLRNLPANISFKQMEELEQTFHFSSSGNSEVLCDWFQHCIRKRYSPAYSAMEKFLLTVGRRKFIKPLYEGMSKDEQLLPLAKSIYQKARPSYHSVSTHTIDEILKVSFE